MWRELFLFYIVSQADERCLPPPVELCLLFKQALCRAAHPLWQSLYWGLCSICLPANCHRLNSRMFFLFFFWLRRKKNHHDTLFLLPSSSAGTLSVFGFRQGSCWTVRADNSSAHTQNTHLLYTLLQALNCLCLSFTICSTLVQIQHLMGIQDRREYFWIMLY